MSSAIQTLVRDFGWIHTGVGMTGNIGFFVGSVLFLPDFDQWKHIGVWLFVIGSFLMLLGSIGNLLVKIYEARED